MGNGDDLTEGICDDDGEDGLGPVNDGVLRKVTGIIADVLHVERSGIRIDTRAADVESWDSFGHVRIVLAIDTAFRIKLSMGAIERADNVAGLVDAVETALAER